jgi:hypothetical protein
VGKISFFKKKKLESEEDIEKLMCRIGELVTFADVASLLEGNNIYMKGRGSKREYFSLSFLLGRNLMGWVE